jgi:hypothetical protein
MHSRSPSRLPQHIIALLATLAATALLSLPTTPVARAQQPNPSGFVQAAPQGFGDRQNGWAWSMAWFKGRLYVGTNRAFHCAEIAAINRILPWFFPYPFDDPDVECTPQSEDLPLRAEIWRWSPSGTWERVYQSPQDVPIPTRPGKTVARDIGYRGMAVYREPDGSEALYVTAVSSRFLGYDVPPPRLLRTTDGQNFSAVPQDPGTLLGDFDDTSMRNPIVYRRKLYVIAGSISGSGKLFESANPAQGNNSFRDVGPPMLDVSAVQVFNGSLYVGINDREKGYSLLKAKLHDGPPYSFKTIIPPGAYNPEQPNTEVLSMQVFKGRLYIGCNGIRGGSIGLVGPAELVRVNADDSWELVEGLPRKTPAGFMQPISGYNAGFNNRYNGHIWRMAVWDGQLWVGTFDSSTAYKNDPSVEPLVREEMGFDLFRSADGVRFTPVSLNGFGDKFNFGVRSLTPTPHGLFLGTANYYYGLQIWQLPGTAAQLGPNLLNLPVIMRAPGE